MKPRAARSLFVACAAALLLLAGCSKKPEGTLEPEGSDANLAPLLAHGASGRAIPGAYLVVFKETPSAKVNALVDELSGSHGFVARFRYRTAVHGFAASLSPVAVRLLREDPRVAYVEEDQAVHLDVVQSNATWGLDRVDQASLPLSTTYTFTQTGTGVDAYVIDTGIRFTHSEFGGRAVAGIDEVTAGGTAADQHGHGTHVAGTIGGTTFGVAKNVRLISVRVLDATGGGTIAGVTAGVDWVTSDHTTRPAVANMSLGGSVSATLDAAVRGSIADGVVYCVAAGNAAVNASIVSPADVSEAITVAASDITDHFASFSNFGSPVDVIAPGVNITSAWLTSDAATNILSGTSMATPHVSGAAALFLESNPTATPAQVAAAIAGAATPGTIVGVPAGTANRLLFTTQGGPPPPPPPPPAPPSLSTPANGATGVVLNPLITWIASSGATSYRLQVSTDPTFATTLIDRAGLTGSSTGITGLSASTQYSWRMSAANAGGSSAFTAPFGFTTGSAPPPPAGIPPVPSLLSPSDGADHTSRTPTLSWSASAGATSYRVQVSTSSSFGTLVYDNPAVTVTSVTLPLLGRRVHYWWHVRAQSSAGASAFSGARQFRTDSN